MEQHKADMQVICTIPVMFSYWAKALDALDAVATSMSSASAVGAGPVTQLNATGPILKSTVQSLKTQYRLFKSRKVFVE